MSSPYAPGVHGISEAGCTGDGWTFEGVARCPGNCGLYFDFEGTPEDLRIFIIAHDCAKEDMRDTP